jgi:hypothetical protein
VVVQVITYGTKKSVFKEGNLTADGTEQVVVDAPGLLHLEGYVDLSEMVAGDEVTLRQYVKIEEGGEYKLYNGDAYSGAQEKPLIHFRSIVGYYGVKVTLQQTAGAYKKFNYQFMKEE